MIALLWLGTAGGIGENLSRQRVETSSNRNAPSVRRPDRAAGPRGNFVSRSVEPSRTAWSPPGG